MIAYGVCIILAIPFSPFWYIFLGRDIFDDTTDLFDLSTKQLTEWMDN